jgi:hypothetical protein
VDGIGIDMLMLVVPPQRYDFEGASRSVVAVIRRVLAEVELCSFADLFRGTLAHVDRWKYCE